jgi:hypothetical protein
MKLLVIKFITSSGNVPQKLTNGISFIDFVIKSNERNEFYASKVSLNPYEVLLQG